MKEDQKLVQQPLPTSANITSVPDSNTDNPPQVTLLVTLLAIHLVMYLIQLQN
jgi:hypothetical protein